MHEKVDDDTKLIIKDVKPEDEGEYVCYAENEDRERSDEITFRVIVECKSDLTFKFVIVLMCKIMFRGIVLSTYDSVI